MKQQVYFGIAIRVVILFVIAMLFTFIPEHLRGFFGDYYIGEAANKSGFIRDGWDWGARHYWFYWMMFILFLLSLLNIAVGVWNLLAKHYPDLFD